MTYKYSQRNYKDKIDTLKNEGIVIDPNEFIRVETFLIVYSYDSLKSVAKHSALYDRSSKKFVLGTTIYDVILLYQFNVDLSSILLKYTLVFENMVRSIVGLTVANKFGVWTHPIDPSTKIVNDYLNEQNYNNSRSDCISVLRSLKKDIVNTRAIQSNINKGKNSSNIHPLFLSRDIKMSKLINWYQILNDSEKSTVINNITLNRYEKINIDGMFVNSLRIIQECRNLMAHNKSIADFKSNTELPYTFKNVFYTETEDPVVSRQEYKSGLGKGDLFSVIIALVVFLEPSIHGQHLLQELQLLFARTEIIFPDVYLSFNLPKGMLEKTEKMFYILESIAN